MATYTKSGIAAMGVLPKAGTAVATATVASTSSVVYAKGGLAVMGGGLTYEKSGLAVMGEIGVFEKAGTAVATAVASGTQVTGQTYEKSGLAVMGEAGGFSKSGLAVATATALSSSSVIYDKVAGELGGPYVWMEEDSTPQAAGSASGTQVTTGPVLYEKAGLAVSAAVASGSSATVYDKTGAAISTATAAGAKQRVYGRTGTATAVALAFGSRTATFTRAGLAISEASASADMVSGLDIEPAGTDTGTLPVHPGCGPLSLFVDSTTGAIYPSSLLFPGSATFPSGAVPLSMSPAGSDSAALAVASSGTLTMDPYE